MKIFRDLAQLPEFNNAVLTIGSFDGVHPGHRHIIRVMQQSAEALNGETVLITFYPHPRIALAEQNGQITSLKLLCDLDEKATLLDQCGLDNLVVVPFTKEFSEQSPDDYIERFLVKYFKPAVIVIGYDHRFGKGRTGDIEYLKKFQSKYSFQLLEISKHEVDGIAVSSTKIRNALQSGDVAHAEKMLGYYYTLSGTVIHGLHLGRKLGFPTANIAVADTEKLIPEDGIYAVVVKIGLKKYKGMLYIGSRPSVDTGFGKTIEVNIFDFSEDIYGQKIKVEFIDFIRADIKFDNLPELSAQLEKDMISAKTILINIETVAP
jgi:riboflavin kinase/FMN adenylyltransferase